MTANTSQHEPRRTPASLWFGVIAPPLAWATQGLASVILALHACHHPEGYSLARSGLVALALLALAFTVSGGTTGWRAWRRLAQQRTLMGAEGQSRVELMAIGGVFLGVTFTLAVLWAGVPTLMVLKVCEAAR
jgi:hypothetical protein